MGGSALLILPRGEVRRRTVADLRERRIVVHCADHPSEVPPASPPRCDALVCSLDLAGPEPLQTCLGLGAACAAEVLLIADRAGRIDPVEALQAGAADFVPHLIGPAELSARVRALLRRLLEYSPRRTGSLALGDVVIDVDRREARVRGRLLQLTPTEFDLLCELARGAGELVTREELLRRISSLQAGTSARALDVHIGRLRSKIERDPSQPELIVTVPHVGYRMAA